MIIYSKNVVFYETIKPAFLEIESGKIKRVIDGNQNIQPDIDYGENYIIPGIIDTHNHGGAGYRFDYADKKGLLDCLKTQACFGVTGIFPTTCNEQQYPLLYEISKENNDGAKVLGIHSEGPWGSRVGEKGINKGYPSVDLKLADKMIEKGNGLLKLVDVAPEIEHGLDAIDYFVSRGVTVGQYHTSATYEESLKGIEHGTTVATHLFNVMTGLHHRDVGVAGASILSDKVDCELICDGLHVSLPMIALAMKMKSHERIMMVSDNTAFLGAPKGKYKGQTKDIGTDREELTVTEEGFVLSKTGRLSGSSKPVLFGMKNLVQKLNMDLVDVCRMSSFNPARKYGLTSKGEIHEGKDADFVVIDADFNPLYTYVEGRKVFDYSTDKIPFNKQYLKENYLGD